MATVGPILLNRRPEAGRLSAAPFGSTLTDAELAAMLELPARKRARLSELSPGLHCSIIGTCLSTGELRQIMGKVLGRDLKELNDHEVHTEGVRQAGRADHGGKLLQKALDKRHQPAINRFAKAATAAEVASLWDEAKRAGDIPSGYWALLSHPAATDALVKAAFADVHMLSHLVGAANRADIRRLTALEAEKAVLETKLQKSQTHIQAADATIRQLNTALAAAVTMRHADAASVETADEVEALRRLVGDLESRLQKETALRARSEERADRMQRREADAVAARLAAEERAEALSEELAALETHLATDPDMEAEEQVALPAMPPGLSTLLYVGGRPSQVHRLRDIADRAGISLLHHDGGMEDRPGLLAGLISRADIACFPVDCVSHDAVAAVKRLCRQAAKPYLPLRSVGLGAFMAGLAKLAASPGLAPES